MSSACERCGGTNLFCSDCDPEAEQRAAALWRLENPDMSVFACTADIQNEYRRRIVAQGDKA